MNWFYLLYLLNGCIAYLNDSVNSLSLPQDYQLLTTYADIVSFSYCKKLSPGKLGEPNSKCYNKRCKNLEYSGIQVLQVFDFNSIESVGAGFVGLDHDSKSIFLAFRGTSTKRDWLANMNFFLKKYKPLGHMLQKQKFECHGCQVHRGFYNFVEDNCIAIISSVKQLRETYSDYKVVVLGHSLGGAFALLSGIEFQLLGFNPTVVTFAGPRIGNKEMMKFVDKIFDSDNVALLSTEKQEIRNGYVRVVHKNDIVPMLPPASLSFVHGGVEYAIMSERLPHLPESLERKGTSSVQNDKTTLKEDFLKLTRILPEFFTNFEHTHYFVEISVYGCK